MARRGRFERSREPEADYAGGRDVGVGDDEGVGDEGMAGKRPGANWRFGVIALAAAVLGLGVGAAALALFRDDGGDAKGEDSTEVADRLVVQGPVIPPLAVGPDPALGQAAPVLDGETLAGEPFTTASGGRPRMLVFFAHWCESCVSELPRIVELAEQDVFEGIDVVGVSTAASSSRRNYPASAWLRRERWPYPTIADTGDGAAARAFGAPELPYFVFIDAGGLIAGRASGPVSNEDLTTIARALSSGLLTGTTVPSQP